jgi:two-component system sensor histidine kinase UhpB
MGEGQAEAQGGARRAGWDKRTLLRVAIAVAAAQLLYWFVLRPILIDFPAQPAATYEISNPRAATLTEPTIEALDAGVFEAVEIPWWSCCLGYRAVSFDWTMEDVPAGGVGLIPRVDADNVMILVNGAIVRAEGRMRVEEVTHHRMRSVIFVSPGLLREGTNRLDIIMTRAALPYFDVTGPPVIGEYGPMMASHARRVFIFNEYHVISYTIGFVLAVIALMVMLRSQRRAFPFWVFVLTLAWSLLAHFYVWTDPPFPALARMCYYFALTNLIPVAWFALADAWTERPMKWLAPASVGIYALAMGVTVFVIFRLEAPAGFDMASEIANWLGIGFAVAAVARFLWHIVRHREERAAEVGIFALCIFLLAFDRYAEIVQQRNGGNLQLTLPLLLLALTLAYLGRNIRLFQSLAAFNATLTAKVTEREAELSEAHARERALVARQAHEAERQRIMLDMHDGLGSQLMSLLLAAKRANLTSERMAEGLQSIIDEMRLLIESMDSVGESLASALATFRQRIEPRVREASMSFTWSNNAVTPSPRYGPREVLQIFRVMQEAVTNAMKHSGAAAIAVTISDTGDSAFPKRIVIADNGAGFAVAPGAGRGLDNMRKRAASIGARLDIRTRDQGVEIVLDLPARDVPIGEAA